MPEHLPLTHGEAPHLAGVALADTPAAGSPTRSWVSAAWFALAAVLVLITLSGLLGAFLTR